MKRALDQFISSLFAIRLEHHAKQLVVEVVYQQVSSRLGPEDGGTLYPTASALVEVL